MSLLTLLSNHQKWYYGWRRVLVHGVFWFAIFLYEAVQASFTIREYNWLFYVVTLREVITTAGVHYLLVYYAVPKLLKGRWVIFILCLWLCYVVMTAGVYYTLYFIREYNLETEYPASFVDFFLRYDFWFTLIDPIRTYNILLFYGSIFYSLLIKTTKDFFVATNRSFKLEKENIQLEKEKTEMELDFLKAQINPHFFFNTLNNIYSLIVDKDEFAASIVLKLSDLMRYSLYESSNNKIPLSRELQFIQDYVKLEKIRHKEHVVIKTDIQPVGQGLEIPPLILITFVENAFKHGVKNTIAASQVAITASVKDTTLMFVVKNSKPATLRKETVQGGIGLVNVRRRLDLLYPDRYHLTVDNQPSYYTVNLTIVLHENPTQLRDRRRRTPRAESYREVY